MGLPDPFPFFQWQNALLHGRCSAVCILGTVLSSLTEEYEQSFVNQDKNN